MTVRFLCTAIPGWYDAGYLEENKLKPENGAIIRSVVEVNAKKITQQLKDEEKRLRELFGDKVRLFVKPKVIQDNKLEVVIDGKTDEQKVAQYVEATIKDEARFSAKRAIKYLVNCLQQCGVGVAGQKLTFLSAEAHNWLSFGHVKVVFTKQGLVLLKGINKDVPGRSNGGGKTNCLSLIPSIMFGETLKEQKNDELAFEHNEDMAWGKLRLRNGQGQLIEIYRQRRPHAITLRVNGKDVSSGITGKGKGETQGLIEKYTGFDLHLLKNSVYIDQTVVNEFVFGAQKARMDLINKLENLERFDAALKVVKSDTTVTEKLVAEAQAKVTKYEESCERVEKELEELKAFKFDKVTNATLVATLRSQLKKKQKDLNIAKNRLNKLARVKIQEPDESGLNDLVMDTAQAEGNVKYYEKELQRAVTLQKAGKCPVCRQPVGKVGSKAVERTTGLLQGKKRVLKRCREAEKQEKERLYEQHEICFSHKSKLRDYRSAIEQKQEQVEWLLDAYNQQKEQQAVINEKRTRYRQELRLATDNIEVANALLKKLDVKLELLDYAQKAFNRGGMPLYLSASLCPLLTKAATEYSNEFSEGTIQLSFEIVDGQFIPSVINTSGSQTTKGQSDGESAMVGLIAAFALREAAPRTNLLVIDEPGRGLDPKGAKQFAEGLVRMKKRWSTIIATTHSQIIESVLAGEKIWKVVKRNRVSRLVQ